MSKPLWNPSQYLLTRSHMAQFLADSPCDNYTALHQWSIDNKNDFWKQVTDYCELSFAAQPHSIMQPGKSMRDTTWFEGATFNFAQRMLRRNDAHIAIQYAREDGLRETLTYQQLNRAVMTLATQLQQLGIIAGDRVAGFLPNSPDTVIAMLATTLLGAIWTSCSPDFGLDGVLDRFSQIQPKVLFAVESHVYNGKTYQHNDLIEQVKTQISSIETVIIAGALSQQQENNDVNIEPFPFDHPTYILYSSGTTGKPKCMVHGAGGTLLQHLKELMLHSDLNADDTMLFYTTCGWMMWNWMVSSLAVGATIVLYDGTPFPAQKTRLYDLIDEFGVTHFGVGAKFLESSEKFGIVPAKSHSLDTLRCVLTTGSPLLPNSFDYVYQSIKPDVQLSSISGGSDIISCFALGNPILPVYRGEIQCMGLGMDVHVFNDEGHAVTEQKGELVCTSAFPSRPLYFWDDADGRKYKSAYYDGFSNVWTHGDFAEYTTHGGLIIYGRSDATLNPRGVRIGTAEIYRQVDKFPDILDCVAVGKETDGGEEVVLFVVLQSGIALDDTLIAQIKKQIRSHASPLHVPAHFIQVPDLPRTVSGKTVELAVKNMLNGRPVKNANALANPESLEQIAAIIHKS
ncbi:MAG: acetoacetate--CoA ligase [Coxiella sp. (in: Bacteria)]|nr:MAG: acetoacetate--CoA ligase [Coxiella sp. (in: g-proteobacteria)]